MTASQARVRILAPEVARKIAAGEVIERPASVVRELLDNAIDAGADDLELHITSGGIESVRLVDNGRGIHPADLPTCVLSHATSKITTAEDLQHVGSLGFRGEALASIASVARLEITSRESAHDSAYRLTVEAGTARPVQTVAGSPGTTVAVNSLFYCVPARKKFLKNPGAETSAVRATVNERASAFPHLQFRFFVDNTLKIFCPRATSAERVAAVLGNSVASGQLHEIHGSGPGFEISVVLAGPEHYRRDRKQIQIFVNRRHINEFSFVQAVEHAYKEFMPGGRYPIACVFVECAPELADFNVHPAKKEVRFRSKADIRRRLIDLIREYLHAYDLSANTLRRVFGPQDRSGPFAAPREAETQDSPSSNTGGGLFSEAETGHWSAAERAAMMHRTQEPTTVPRPAPPADRTRDPNPATADAPETGAGATSLRNGARGEDSETGTQPQSESVYNSSGVRYLGQVYGVFLLVEYCGRLLVLDQHAAHERILYERFRKRRQRQQLLVPIDFEADENQESHLTASKQAWNELGLQLSRQAPGHWRIEAVPDGCREREDALIEAVLEAAPHTDSLSDRFYAELACKAAVKDGSPLDNDAAEQLIAEALRLPHPRCPHGRPLWAEITRDELYRRVQRT